MCGRHHSAPLLTKDAHVLILEPVNRVPQVVKKKKKGSVGVINFRTLKWEEYPRLLRQGQWKVRERHMTVEAGDIEIRR